MRMWTSAAAGLVLLAGLVGPAWAQHRGLLVRLNAGGEQLATPVTLSITGSDGTPGEVTLNDEGTAPDVAAGDGSWAGALSLMGDSFDVQVTVGGKAVGGGPVSWSPEDSFRELIVQLDGGTMTMEAANADVPAGAGDPTASGPPTGPPSPGTPPGGPVGGPTPPGGAGGAVAVGTRPSAVTFPTGESDDSSLFIGLGLGVLLLVGVGWLWVRGRDANGDRASGLAPQPEPPLLGGPTPSLSDGLSVWTSADPQVLLRPLLATLARHHRVLVAASAAPPPVYGGPVYRVAETRPNPVGDAAEALTRDGGLPVAVLVVGADPATLRDLADALPAGVGGIVLVADPGDVALPVVRCLADDGGWRVEARDGVMRVREDEAGLHPA